MNNLYKINISKLILGLICFFLSMQMLTIKTFYLTNILLLLGGISICLISGSIRINCDRLLLTFVLLSVITLFVAQLTNLSAGYEDVAFSQFFWYVILVVFLLMIDKFFTQDKIKTIHFALKAGVIVQIIWGLLQYVCWIVLKLDINNILFADILHMRATDTATHYEFGNLCIAGLCWHPANLIPVIILGYCLFNKNIWIKILLVVVGVLSSNSTTLIAILCCVIVDVLCVDKDYLRCNLKKIISIVSIIVICCVMLVSFQKEILLFINEITNVYMRISAVANGLSTDSSTTAHVNYYLRLFDLLKNYPFWNTLFGFGYECSGFPYSQMYGQYSQLIWVTEADPVNLIIGRGIIWTGLHYFWLIKIAINGKKISKYYLVAIISIVISGIFYNIQFYWVILFEGLMYIAVKKGLNIWNLE